MLNHHQVNYIEFPCSDFQATKKFFTSVFGWTYIDYSPKYVAFKNAGIDGGFFDSSQFSRSKNGSSLIVFYSESLEKTQELIVKNDGNIIEDIFSFPGGRRFHFTEPSGNEFAVWSDK